MRAYLVIKSRPVLCQGFKHERRKFGGYVLNGKHKFILEHKGLVTVQDVMIRLFSPVVRPLTLPLFLPLLQGIICHDMPAYAKICHFTPSGVCRPGRLTS